jgi:arylsulfatase A-like enzyme
VTGGHSVIPLFFSSPIVPSCLTTLASLSLATIAAAAPLPGTPPNIVIILADDLGYGDLGSQGAKGIKTPNLDDLAREGLRFTDGHSPASVCTPTRYSMLTGQYSWRQRATGLDNGVAAGDSPLLIPTDAVTLPGLLKAAGYRTGLIGKWHLGFGTSKPDYNQDLKPGPLEVGFDEFFGIPATNDRVPTVFVRNHRVVGLDPKDPIAYTYQDPGKDSPMKKYAAGRGRIGWTSGGRSAWWKDIDIADTLTGEAVKFIDRNHAKPFFLCFTPHDVHAPTIPHPRFAGTSGLGPRADMVHELDWSVGELLKTLEKHDLEKNTLVILSSDNGAYRTEEGEHRPNGPWKGEKSHLWEGGHRVPFLAKWPDRIAPGTSSALVSLVDLPATAAAAIGQTLPSGAAPDSFNLLPLMTGKNRDAGRDHLVLMSGKGDLAIRQGPWKYIPDLATANGWASWAKPGKKSPAKPGLYHLGDDPGETKNLHASKPEVSKRLAALLEKVKATPVTRPQ